MRELRALEATLIERLRALRLRPGRDADARVRRGAAARRRAHADVGAYRFFDERGELLAMRSDMTIPIARLVATRFADAEPPFRFSYVGNAYRAVRPQRAQMRQFTAGRGRAARRRRPRRAPPR